MNNHNFMYDSYNTLQNADYVDFMHPYTVEEFYRIFYNKIKQLNHNLSEYALEFIISQQQR